MALTRKMLAAMDIPAEKIEEIITAHVETVNAIKDEKETLKAKADSADELQSKLDAANKELETLKSGDWEKKYSDLKNEYDGFKKDTQEKETKAKKNSAYRKILKEAGIPDNRIDVIMKASVEAIGKLDLDDDGNAKDADKLKESAKTEWADFIPKNREEGAGVENPPENNGGSKPTRASELAAKYHDNLYGKGKEN